MTTIVVARKHNKLVIGADTLVTYGDQLESAELIANHSKLIQVGDTWLAVTGHAALDLALRHLFTHPPEDDDRVDFKFNSCMDIFTTFVGIHDHLKKDFFLKTDEDKEDEFESMQMNLLIANPSGIYGICSKRSVFEYQRFYAYGSGDQYALGAMHAVYDQQDDAEAIARAGLQAAVDFDNSTGAPLELRTISLNSP